MSEARSVTSTSDNGDAPSASSDDPPEPGELKIKERRSWKTWQLLAAALVAAIFGMWINGDTGGGGRARTGRALTAASCLLRARAPPVRPPQGARPRRQRLLGAVPPPRPPPPADTARTTTTHAAGGSTTTTVPRVHDRPSSTAGSRTRTRPPDVATAPGQLDEHAVHDDRRLVEHRLGLQMRPRPGRRSVVPGVRDAGRVGSQWNGRDQRDRTVGTVGHVAVQPRGADARGASPRSLYLDRQGDRLVA